MQHLNLFSQLDRVTEPLLSARQQLRLLAAVAVVMLLGYGWLLLSGGSLQKELVEIKQQQRQLTDSVSQLQAEKQRQLRDNKLARAVESLKRDISFRRQLLASVDPGTPVMTSGFAGHLQGLARQHIQGMWFTRIELLQGGQQLALQGQTRSPELVPRYLQGLAAEPVFDGHHFRIFRLYTPEDTPALHFELRARELGSQPDEGVNRQVATGVNR